METSTFIGSSIFMYIITFVVVMAFFAYLTYRISPKGKQHRAQRRERRDK